MTQYRLLHNLQVTFDALYPRAHKFDNRDRKLEWQDSLGKNEYWICINVECVK